MSEEDNLSLSANRGPPPFTPLAYTRWKFLFKAYVKQYSSATGAPWSDPPDQMILGIAPTATHRAQVETRQQLIKEWVSAENKCYSSLVKSLTSDEYALSLVVDFRESMLDLGPNDDPRTSIVCAHLDEIYFPVGGRVLNMRRKELDQLVVLPLESLGVSFISRAKAAFTAFVLQGGVISDAQRIEYVEDCFQKSPEETLRNYSQVIANAPPVNFITLEVQLRKWDLTPLGIARQTPTLIKSGVNQVSMTSKFDRRKKYEKEKAFRASGKKGGKVTNKTARIRVPGGCPNHPNATHGPNECYITHPHLRPPPLSDSAKPPAKPDGKRTTFSFAKEVKGQLGPVNMVSSVNAATICLARDASGFIIVDTGCGDDLWIFMTKRYFDSVEELTVPVDLATANEAASDVLSVTAYGTIGSDEHIEFCPTSKYNLMGLGRLFGFGFGIACFADTSPPAIVCRNEHVLSGIYIDHMPAFKAIDLLRVIRERVQLTSVLTVVKQKSQKEIRYSLREPVTKVEPNLKKFKLADMNELPEPNDQSSAQPLVLPDESHFETNGGNVTLGTPAVDTSQYPSVPIGYLDLLHRRLGHRSLRSIIHMHQRMLVTGLNIPRTLLRIKLATLTQQKCGTCQKVKIRRHNFKEKFLIDIPDEPTASRGNSTGALDVTLVCDFHVFVNAPSREGLRFALNFTLPQCSATWGFLIQAKTQFLDVCKHLKNTVLLPLNLHWTHFHGDSDTSFFSTAAKEWFEVNGITTSSSPTDTPEMNSVAEAANKVLGELTLSLLSGSGMPITFWGDAYTTALRLKFVLPCKTTRGLMSPFEFIHGCPPDLSRWRVWGCRCWVIEARGDKRKDWHTKGTEGRLIGYSEQPLGWIVWMFENKGPTVSVNVTFDETIPPTSLEYFADISKWLVAESPVAISIDKFHYLVGKVFRDDEDGLLYQVAKVGTVRANQEQTSLPSDRYIVAYVRLFVAGVGAKLSPILRRPIFIADVVRMVAVTETESIKALKRVLMIDATPSPEVEPQWSLLTSSVPSESGRLPDVAPPVEQSDAPLSQLCQQPDQLVPELVCTRGKLEDTERPRGNPTIVCGRRHSLPNVCIVESAHSDRAVDTQDEVNLPPSCLDPSPGVNLYSLYPELEAMVAELDEHPDAEHWTRADMLASPHKTLFLAAEAKELASIEERGVIEAEVPIPPGVRPISTKFVYKSKKGQYTPSTADTPGSMNWGAFIAKARWTPRGFLQKPSDIGETFAPTGKNVTLRLVLCLCLMFTLNSCHIDVDTAFLYAPLNRPVYIEGPPGRPCKDGYCLKAVKALYGLKEAPREWNRHLRDFILTLGFTQSLLDSCLFFKRSALLFVIVLIYVDDVLIFAHDIASMLEVKRAFSNKFKIKDIGPITHFLGMEIEIAPLHVSITQTEYCEKVLERFRGYWDFYSSPRKSPLPTNTQEWLSQDSLPIEGTPVMSWYSEFPYMSVIGSLLYLAINTRPDIIYAVCMLARYSRDKMPQACYLVCHLCSYLSGTTKLGVRYTKPNFMNPDLHAFSDASFASCWKTLRSVAGYLVFMCCGAIAWYSKLLTTVAASTMESEYMAAFHMGQEVIFIRNLLEELQVPLTAPTPCFLDAMAAIQSLKNPVFHARTKHISVKIRWIQQHCTQDGTKHLAIHYVGTADMLADDNTKAVPLVTAERHLPFILGQTSWLSSDFIASYKQPA